MSSTGRGSSTSAEKKMSGNIRNRTAKAKSESENKDREVGNIDVYIRMQENPERDYCFSVPVNKPISFFKKIIETLPSKMSPGYFYYDNAESFAVSVHPGYMTSEGCLLFSDDAHISKYQKSISETDIIGDTICEGQLIIPQWKYNYRRWYLTLFILLTWLYLDLPEFISPTPGTAPTTFILWMLEEVIPLPKRPENDYFAKPIWQCVFFFFHIVKVCFFYLILWNGAWHPNTLNPLAPYGIRKPAQRKIPDPEELKEIGWTGDRRASVHEWASLCLDYRVKTAGGIVEASKQGLFKKPLGYYLNLDEGWAVLKEKTIDKVNVDDDLLDGDGKFVVSKQYFKELAKPIVRFLSEKSDDVNETITKIHEFRKFGYYEGSKTLKELFEDLIPNHEK